MSEREHTPGPWEFVPADEWYAGSGCGVKARTPEGPGHPTPSATGFYAVACPPPHGKDRAAEQEANARLIAAAPCLLSALQEAVTEITNERDCFYDAATNSEGEFGERADKESCDELDALLDRLNAAISRASAEGGE